MAGRRRWYDIDESDAHSQRAFGLLNYLYLIMSPGGGAGAPLLTVPIG